MVPFLNFNIFIFFNFQILVSCLSSIFALIFIFKNITLKYHVSIPESFGAPRECHVLGSSTSQRKSLAHTKHDHAVSESVQAVPYDGKLFSLLFVTWVTKSTQDSSQGSLPL